MEFNLNDTVGIVTGVSGGLGKAISEVLIGEGANIIGVDIVKKEQLLEFIERINGKRNCFFYCKGNVKKERDINNVLELAIQKYKKIDFIVNNAGIWPTAYVKDMSLSEWEEVFKINLTGAFLLSKKFVNYLIDNKRKGKIVNIVSQAAFLGSTSGHAHYAASKAGLVAFTISLAREVAGNNINVNAIAPGIVETEMMNEVLKNREREYLKKIPLGRIAKPKEIAYAVAFILSDKADYITGATLDITGGMLMR